MEVTAYDPVADAWQPLAPLPTPLLAPVAQPVGNRVVIALGGAPPNGFDNVQGRVYVADFPVLPERAGSSK